MIGDILFYVPLIISIGFGLLYFRDLGDVSQMVIRVKRKDMHRFIRNEYHLIGAGLGCFVITALAYFIFDGGVSWLFWVSLALIAFLYGFPWVWVHVALRNQKKSATYYPIEEAWEWVNPSSGVVVIEKGGVARAHPDNHIMRPHLAGNEEGLNGENVVMTYCALSNLGTGYVPEIEGEEVELEVVAQHGNNLILRDNRTGEPIQQIYGHREKDGENSPGMANWPTFRMSFRGFVKAYPEGTVFLNKPSKNLLLRLFDMAVDVGYVPGIIRQHNEAKPLMDNMTRVDDRLHNKTYIWGVNIGRDAVCYTDDFVIEKGGLINATIGGRDIVVTYDPIYESIGVWYNDSGVPISEIDFFGKSDQGQLQRVETLKPGMFWHAWAEFYPHTDINRVGKAQG
ncbi:MAG: DUF3179 domain-containing (seleno)protein [Desulfocapsaceae bacterium]